MLMGQGATDDNRQTKPCGLMFDYQASEWFAVVIGIMPEIPTPHIMLDFCPGLDGASSAKFSPALPTGESESLLRRGFIQ